MNVHDGVSKLWILRRESGLDLDGFEDELQAIDALVRCLMLKDSSDEAKTVVIAVVERALKHVDDLYAEEPDEENPDD